MRALVWLLVAGCAAAAPRPNASPGKDLGDVLQVAAAGRPVLVELFATWCEVCRGQAPELSRLAAELGPGVYVAGIDVGEPEADAARVLRHWDVRYPVHYDPEARFADGLGVTQLPSLLVLAPDGAVLLRARTLDPPTLRAVRAALGVEKRIDGPYTSR